VLNEHLNVVDALEEVKANEGVFTLVGFVGDDPMVTTGATVSTVKP